MADQKTFMDYLAPDSVKGLGLMGIDQGARQAQSRQDAMMERMEKQRRGGVYTSPTTAELAQGANDYEYLSKARRQLRPGGANFEPDDTMC